MTSPTSLTSSMDEEFIGWIPTAGCRLSFSVVGFTNNPERAVTANVADSETRAVLSFQHRFLSDSAIPTDALRRFVSRRVFKTYCDFWMVCYALTGNSPTNHDEPLKGEVLLFENKNYWRNVKDEMRHAKNTLMAFNRDASPSLREYLDECAINESVREAGDAALMTATFEISRDGVCTLHASTKDIGPKEDEARAKTKKDLAADSTLRHALIAQIFFFLKDICHIHQHHHPKTDTVVDVHKQNAGESEILWMSCTLRALYRKVLDFKRKRDEDLNESSRGMLAYILAFEEIAKNRLTDDKFRSLPIKNSRLLQESIAATKEKRDALQAEEKSKKDRRLGTFLTLMLALTAIAGLGSFVHPIPSHNSGGDWIRFLVWAFVERPVITIPLIFGITFFVDHYFIHPLDDSIKRVKGIRGSLAIEFIRLVQGFRQKAAATFYLAIGLFLFLGYSWYIIHFVIFD